VAVPTEIPIENVTKTVVEPPKNVIVADVRFENNDG
jgi:hypothetical protein